MPISMYDASVPLLQRALLSLDGILVKAVEHCDHHDIDPAVLLNSRLYPNMFSLDRQVQLVTDFALRGACRLAGNEPESVPDDEKTFADLRSRVAGAIEQLNEYRPEQINGSETRQISLNLPIGAMTFDGKAFLQYFVLPNVYFHITTAYNILRENGVQLGKTDFLGAS